MMFEFIFSGSIPVRVQLLAIGASLFLLLFIVQLIRGGRLKEGYSLLWFFIAVLTVLFSVFTDLLELLADAVGISYAPAALFLVLVGGLFLLSIHYSLLLHRYDKRIRTLAQEHAILQEKLARGESQRSESRTS